jgi:hypothetical protein
MEELAMHDFLEWLGVLSLVCLVLALSVCVIRFVLDHYEIKQKLSRLSDRLEYQRNDHFKECEEFRQRLSKLEKNVHSPDDE